jgi:hypothetical protein
MPSVVFKPTIPVFDQAKTVHALGRAATVIGCCFDIVTRFFQFMKNTSVKSLVICFSNITLFIKIIKWIRIKGQGM